MNAFIFAMSNDTDVKRDHYYASHEKANKSVKSVHSIIEWDEPCTTSQNSLIWAIQIKKKNVAEFFDLNDTN